MPARPIGLRGRAWSMQEKFKIYVDRLSGGQEEVIKECFSPDFMDISDGTHKFPDDIFVEGKAYLADSHLILHLDIAARYTTSCKICNEDISLPLNLKGLYLTEEVENIPGHVFDMQNALRDSILLEIPMYSECEGHCPKRFEYSMYLKSPSDEPPSPTTIEE